MLKIVFNDGKEVVAFFEKTSENIVSIGNANVNTSGFKAYRESDSMFLGDYSDYTTVYKEDNEKISYSNDGSVYVEPEVPEFDETAAEDIVSEPLTPAEEAANMSLAERVTQCEECILELSSVVYAE